MYICIAGKNKCAVDAVKFLLYRKLSKDKILILPNHNDSGKDDWQPSLKKFAIKNKIKITKPEKLYSIKQLFFFSLEYDKIINIKKFHSENLFNLHFSLLPKYRGCHTNFLQVYHGEKYSGVTLHKINNGIDEGDVIDQKKFMIKLNDTAYDNYFKLMKCSVLVFKKNINKIIKSKYSTKKQKLSSGHYYTRGSVDYKKISKFNMKKPTLKIHNKIRSLIFPPFQIPVVNGIRVKKSLYKKNKIYLIESFSNKFKNR